MVVGQSDFRFSGTLNNYLNYIFKEGTLRADLRLNSRRVNLNELFRLKKKERNTEAPQVVSNTSSVVEEKPVLAFNVPARVDLTFRSNIANALINRIPSRDLQGVIKAADKKLVLQNLSMNMLDGQLYLNGSYQNTSENRPVFDFGFNVRNFDIPAMFSTFSGFQEKAPGAINSTGKLSSKMQLSGRLNEQLEWIPATINGEGTFGTQNLEIVNSPVFNKLNGIISRERLQNVRVDDFTASLRVESGNLFLEPFEPKVIGQETKVVGS